MAVLLKNLVARPPNIKDLDAIAALVVACEGAEHGIAGSSLEDLPIHIQRPDFHLATDAWVIVTTRGQIVGFACVWHEEHALISTFLCVDPEYRNRGIGTLLLRLVEVRVRQLGRLVAPGERVVLRSLLSKANANEQLLFEREGYQAGRQFLRISFTLAEDTGALPVADAQQKLRADICLEQGKLLGATPLYDRDGLCSVHTYRTYEKELCPAKMVHNDAEDGLALSNTVVGVH